MATSGALIFCLDARIRSEYTEVLARPRFHFQPEAAAALLASLFRNGLSVSALPLAASLPDPDDNPFLEVAIAGAAEFLITGNGAHFPKKHCQGVVVVSPRECVDAFRGANIP